MIPIDAQPWSCYGQQTGPSGSYIDNPTANQNNLLGEALLPYTVPAGLTLVLTGWGIEAYETISGSFVLVPWIGNPPATNAKCLHSVLSSAQSNFSTGFFYYLPEGTILNARIMCSEAGNPVAGWWIGGYLIPDQTINATIALDRAIRSICPIDGVSIGNSQDKSTWRIDFADSATAAQRALARAVLNEFNWRA